MLKSIFLIISGGSIKLKELDEILFKDDLPNEKLFEYLLYNDNIHDNLANIDNLQKKFITDKFYKDLSKKNEEKILLTIYTILRYYSYLTNLKFTEYIRINNKHNLKSLYKNDIIFDTIGKRKKIGNIYNEKNFLINFDFKNIFNDEYEIDEFDKTIEMKQIYLTKLFDGSSKIIKIKKDKIINENIKIPGYFFLSK